MCVFAVKLLSLCAKLTVHQLHSYLRAMATEQCSIILIVIMIPVLHCPTSELLSATTDWKKKPNPQNRQVYLYPTWIGLLQKTVNKKSFGVLNPAPEVTHAAWCIVPFAPLLFLRLSLIIQCIHALKHASPCQVRTEIQAVVTRSKFRCIPSNHQTKQHTHTETNVPTRYAHIALAHSCAGVCWPTIGNGSR